MWKQCSSFTVLVFLCNLPQLCLTTADDNVSWWDQNLTVVSVKGLSNSDVVQNRCQMALVDRNESLILVSRWDNGLAVYELCRFNEKPEKNVSNFTVCKLGYGSNENCIFDRDFYSLFGILIFRPLKCLRPFQKYRSYYLSKSNSFCHRKDVFEVHIHLFINFR